MPTPEGLWFRLQSVVFPYRKVGTPVENAGELWRLSRRRSWVELRRSRQTSMKSMFYVRYGGRAGIRGTNDLKANAAQAPWHLNSPERPDTGWTNNNVVTGRQAAGCSAGNRRARSRDWLASQDRAGDARRRLDRKRRMTMARRMRKVVPARGGNRARYEAGRQAK
jgi:hypothetical protein